MELADKDEDRDRGGDTSPQDGDLDEAVPVERRAPLNPHATRWASQVQNIGASGRSVLMVLAAHADRFGCSCCGQVRLAKQGQVSERTVRSKLQQLEAQGLIRRFHRMTRYGGRTTDVTMLIGWPDRYLVPPQGHPKFGRRVVESAVDRLERAWAEQQARKALPPPPAKLATIERESFKTKVYSAEELQVLLAAVKALGTWATDANRESLMADGATLIDWIASGLQLPDLISVLHHRCKPDRAAPTIRTWRYFHRAVQPLFGKVGPGKPDQRPPRSEASRALAGAPGHDDTTDPFGPQHFIPSDDFLRRMVHAPAHSRTSEGFDD